MQKIKILDSKCINCGVCTALCPTGALVLDKITWELKFSEIKCINCFACEASCPLGAIKK